MVRPLGMTEDEYQAFVSASIARAKGKKSVDRFPTSVHGGGYLYSIKEDDTGDYTPISRPLVETVHICFGRYAKDGAFGDWDSQPYPIGGEDYSTAALSQLQSRAV